MGPQEGHTLFSIPRELTLSARTSSLPELLGKSLWKQSQLGKGWVGLILCMMWEESRGQASPWSTYLSTRRVSFLLRDDVFMSQYPIATLPESFDTPMFWNDEDIKELQGTAVVGVCMISRIVTLIDILLEDKIGKADAEKDYYEKLVPVVKVTITGKTLI